MLQSCLIILLWFAEWLSYKFTTKMAQFSVSFVPLNFENNYIGWTSTKIFHPSRNKFCKANRRHFLGGLPFEDQISNSPKFERSWFCGEEKFPAHKKRDPQAVVGIWSTAKKTSRILLRLKRALNTLWSISNVCKAAEVTWIKIKEKNPVLGRCVNFPLCLLDFNWFRT